MKKLLPLFILALWSCEKEIDYQIPDPGPQITVDFRLEANEEILGMINRSVYSMSNDDPSVLKGASARIFSDQADSPFVLEEFENSDLGFNVTAYRHPHRLQAGKSYRLEVQHPELPTLTSTLKVPEQIDILGITRDPEADELLIRFKDPAATGNYYKFMIYGTDNDAYPLWFSSADLRLEFFNGGGFDPLEGDDDVRGYGNEAYLSDRTFNGQERVVRLRIEHHVSSPTIQVLMYHISEDEYLFDRSLAAHSFGDDFFSEPVPVFFNTEGGYGIFTARSKDVVEMAY